MAKQPHPAIKNITFTPTRTYFVRGTDQAQNAIGKPEPFVIEVEAERMMNHDDIEYVARETRYKVGREHVLVTSVKPKFIDGWESSTQL